MYVDFLSVPGARPQYHWNFQPPFNRSETTILVIRVGALKHVPITHGNFPSAHEPFQVATKFIELLSNPVLLTSTIFILLFLQLTLLQIKEIKNHI